MKERFAKIMYAASVICAGTTLLIPVLIALDGNMDVFIPFFLIALVIALIVYSVGWSIRYIITGDKSSFLLVYLASVKQKKYSIFMLANLPIYDFIQQTPPLDMAEKSSDITDDEDVNALIYSGIISYQLLIYLEYVRIRFGSEVCRVVEEQMYITLDRPTEDLQSSSLGKTTKIFIDIGRQVLLSDPVVIDDGQEQSITLPTELVLASCFLLNVKGSPYNLEKGDEALPAPEALNLAFAQILENARIGVFERYSKIIFNKLVTLDKASTMGIRVEDCLQSEAFA